MKESIHELAKEATKEIKDYRKKLYQADYYQENKQNGYVILKCPVCKQEQDEKFKETKTINMYCDCNVNGYMYTSLKGDKYIKYGRKIMSKL